jgi:hypothetical protein
MYVQNEERIGDYLIQISPDEYPESPRDWDNMGKMICFHKRDNYGDKHNIKSDDYDSWEEMEKDLRENHDAHTILPIYMYEHSGVTISTSPFSDYFDSGRLGLIYCTNADAKELEQTYSGQDIAERAEVLLKGEIETYNQYLSGDIYGYRIFKISKCDQGHEHQEQLDSCWGYYGEDECMEEAKSIVAYYTNQKEAV